MASNDIMANVTAESQYDPQMSDMFVQSPEESELADEITRDIASDRSAVNAWREEARKAYRYYHGHQWDDIDKMRMEQLKRPAIVFDMIKPTIDAISGMERMNRHDIRFVSRAFDSNLQRDMAGDLATAAVSTVLDMCNGDDERSRAALDVAVGGMGWVEAAMDYDKDPEGRVILRRVNAFEMGWDSGATMENLEDAQRFWRERQIPRGLFKKLWPGKLEMVDAMAPEYDEWKVTKYELVTPFYSRANESANPQVGKNTQISKNIPVFQFQKREMQPFWRYIENGDVQEIDEEGWSTIKSRSTALGLPTPPAVRQLRPVYKQTFISRGIVLEAQTELPKGFTLMPITGQWDTETKVWYGIVRPMIDPQNTMNKSMSSALTFLLANAKGGTLFNTGAFEDDEMAKAQWARPDAWIAVRDGVDISKAIVSRKSEQPPTIIGDIFKESKSAMSYVSGVSEEMMGTSQSDATSPTAAKRVQQGLAVLGWFFDNIARHRREESRMLLEFVREYWSQGQLVRVGGTMEQQVVPILASNLPLDYELVLDDSIRHNPNLRAKVWDDLQPIIPSLLRFGYAKFLLRALEFSPLPAQLVAELQREAQNPQPEKPGGKGKGGGKAPDDPNIIASKVAKMSAEAAKAQAEARSIDGESKFKLASLVMDSVLGAAEVQHKNDLMKHRSVVDVVKAVKAGAGSNVVRAAQQVAPAGPSK